MDGVCSKLLAAHGVPAPGDRNAMARDGCSPDRGLQFEQRPRLAHLRHRGGIQLGMDVVENLLHCCRIEAVGCGEVRIMARSRRAALVVILKVPEYALRRTGLRYFAQIRLRIACAVSRGWAPRHCASRASACPRP
ncbi:hypothetical protein APY03_5682 [Variovorax sp. WDL1]|nr:hypothetical protein APY03_5682 [Variovorax sp. WDL1]